MFSRVGRGLAASAMRYARLTEDEKEKIEANEYERALGGAPSKLLILRP